MAQTSAISFERVSRVYKNGVVGLRDVSWSLPVGGHLALLGPNGAGKSTSIRLIQGALRLSTGQVTLLGASVGSAGYLDARKRTGIMPQSPGTYEDLTGREYLELARSLFGASSFARVVDAFGLGPHLDKRLDELSGGLQRRVSLAAALVGDPEVVLLDEPTLGLDPIAVEEVTGYIRDLMKGRSTLLCTNNLAEAEALCDEVIIIDRGRMLRQQNLARLETEQRPSICLRAVQPDSELVAALRRLGHEPVASPQGDGVTITVGDPRAEVPAILRSLLRAKIDVYESQVTRESLRDLFFEVIKRGEGS